MGGVCGPPGDRTPNPRIKRPQHRLTPAVTRLQEQRGGPRQPPESPQLPQYRVTNRVTRRRRSSCRAGGTRTRDPGIMRPLAFATAVDPRRQDVAPTPLWPRWVTLLDAVSWHEPWHATRFSCGRPRSRHRLSSSPMTDPSRACSTCEPSAHRSRHGSPPGLVRRQMGAESAHEWGGDLEPDQRERVPGVTAEETTLGHMSGRLPVTPRGTGDNGRF